MKKFLAVALIFVATLTACSKSRVQTEQSSSSSSTQQSSSSSSSTQQSSTSSSEVKKDDNELYQSVFSDYQAIFDFAHSADKSNVEKMMAVLRGLHTPVNSWVMESAVYAPSNLVYAFYDINHDGQNELFIGSENSDGSVFVKGFYGIVDGQVSLLAEGFVAGQGGARSAVALFNDGEFISYGWSSGTGDAIGMLKRLDTNGQVSQVSEKEFHIQDTIATVFGKNESDLLDPRQFNWEGFGLESTETESTETESTETESTETSSSDQADSANSMNLEQIQAGNFSSLEGEWVNSRGDRMVIDSQGNVTYNGGSDTIFVDVQSAKFEGQVLMVGITNPNAMASPTIPTLLIPKGVQNTYGFLEGHSDQTDTSKDRLFSTQSVTTTEGFSQGVFYRVDD